MSEMIRIGGNKSRDHRGRKNPQAHEAWVAAKKVRNASIVLALFKTHDGKPFGRTGSWGSGKCVKRSRPFFAEVPLRP